MSDNDYNGYTNWETWNVALFIGEGWSDALDEEIREYHANNEEPIDGDFVREFFETYMGGTTPDFNKYTELHKINWRELAETWLSDIPYYQVVTVLVALDDQTWFEMDVELPAHEIEYDDLQAREDAVIIAKNMIEYADETAPKLAAIRDRVVAVAVLHLGAYSWNGWKLTAH